MVNKTLFDVLSGMESYSKVSIGTEKGGGFMFIGTVEKALNDIHKLFNNDLKRQKYYMFKDYQILNKNAFLTPEDGDILLYCKAISDTYRRYKAYRDQIDNFKDPMKRPIKNIYQEEDGSIRIIISGREKGPIWIEEEYGDPFININLVDKYDIEEI